MISIILSFTHVIFGVLTINNERKEKKMWYFREMIFWGTKVYLTHKLTEYWQNDYIWKKKNTKVNLYYYNWEIR